MEEQKCKHEIEQKLAEGHMLTEREAQMLARFAEEQGQEAEGIDRSSCFAQPIQIHITY